jgi:hypothetical protein
MVLWSLYRRPAFFNSNINRLLLILFSFRDKWMESVFKVYFDRDYRYHKYRLATSRMHGLALLLTLMACTMFSFNMGAPLIYIDGRFI